MKFEKPLNMITGMFRVIVLMEPVPSGKYALTKGTNLALTIFPYRIASILPVNTIILVGPLIEMPTSGVSNLAFKFLGRSCTVCIIWDFTQRRRRLRIETSVLSSLSLL